MGETETAYHYASRHLDIAKETGDRTGQATAQQNLTELGKSLGYGEGMSNGKKTPASPVQSRRLSMENMQVVKRFLLEQRFIWNYLILGDQDDSRCETVRT